MSTPDSAMVCRFQADRMGEVFRRAADWLDEPAQQGIVIESLSHVQLPRAPGGPELLSIFYTSADQPPSSVQPIGSAITWNSVARAIFDDLGIGYAPTGRQVTARHTECGQWILLLHAVQMVKAIVLGPYKALDPAESPDVVPDSIDIDRLHEAATAWFGEIINHFGGPAILADKTCVVRTVAVRIALAALGSAYYSQDQAAIASARSVLSEIDWTVSAAWQGIGGQVVVSGDGLAMTSGSGKSSISRAVNALKPDTESGRAVRARTTA